MSHMGGLLTFDIVGGLEAGSRFVEATRVALLATSLGGPETLVTHPASTTHVGLDADELAAAGITEGTIRVSVGLEHEQDVVADFLQALAAATLTSVPAGRSCPWYAAHRTTSRGTRDVRSGHSVSGTLRCAVCRTPMDEGAVRCPSCGASLDEMFDRVVPTPVARSRSGGSTQSRAAHPANPSVGWPVRPVR